MNWRDRRRFKEGEYRPGLQQFQRAVQLRVGVVKVRREAEVVLALAVGAQGRHNAGVRQFFVQRREVLAGLVK